MLTDILLLDLFNTLGLPTSTTVSIVFELLGATVVTAIIAVSMNPEVRVIDYVNYSKATEIISGIFISIGLAFTIGLIIQSLSRLIFTFHFNQNFKKYGWIWAGVAFSAITYFLFIKGLKGASFVKDSWIIWIDEHSQAVFLILFTFWSIYSILNILVLKWNVLRQIVLAGTFSLAFAFAGNDLVNFIGVPVAGFESYRFLQESGAESSSFMMEQLSQPVRTSTIYLLLAGIIMSVTLWKSAKAKTVTKTEVDLARQAEGTERFQPNYLSNQLVDKVLVLSAFIRNGIPAVWREKVSRSFAKKLTEDTHAPSFDLIRASVNLTVASIIISIATSLKLPLSTTYVSFMVAMGTSLADGAWGKESAVYRVSGVLNVVGGWLMTALIAFLVSGLFAFILWKMNWVGLSILLILVVFSVIKGSVYHKKRFNS
jgi:phosphate/sulfate permease